MKSYIKHFSEISIADVPGCGKNASSAKCIINLRRKVYRAEGATTALAFKDFKHNSLIFLCIISWYH
jgi:hypothetical protein